MYTPVSPSFIIELRHNWVKLCYLDGHQSFKKQIKPIKMGKWSGKRTSWQFAGSKCVVCHLRPKERNCNHQCDFLGNAVTAHTRLSVPQLSLTVSPQNDF